MLALRVEDWSWLAWVMLQGRASRVDDDASYAAALAELRAKYVQYAGASFRIETNPMIRLAIHDVVAWSAAPPPSRRRGGVLHAGRARASSPDVAVSPSMP